jgi:hypothetical protein
MPGNPRLRSTNRGHAFAAVIVSTAFLWALALSASPQLHGKIHHDANRVEHTCAIVFIASGSFTYSGPAPLANAPVPALQFSIIPALTSCWVESPFLGAFIFEHAPPTYS